MSEGVILTIVTIFASIIGFFLIRWINSVDEHKRNMVTRMEELEKKVEEKLSQLDQLQDNSVHKHQCTHIHQEMTKQLMRERYRINDILERMENGPVTRKVFAPYKPLPPPTPEDQEDAEE